MKRQIQTPPRLDNRYLVEEEIGEGSFGRIYRVRDSLSNRRLALKRLRDHSAQTEYHLLREFDSHAGIVSPVELGFLPDGGSYFTMDYVDGVPFPTAARSLSKDSVLRLAEDLAWALDAMHLKQVRHGDLKPENVLVTLNPVPELTVLDVGLATMGSAPQLEIAELDQAPAGSLAYLAPEQVLGNEVSFSADIFSFGVLFAEALQGERPFQGTNSRDLLGKIQSGTADLGGVEVPELKTLLHSCLEREPSLRPTAKRVAETLRKIHGKASPEEKAHRLALLDRPPRQEWAVVHALQSHLQTGEQSGTALVAPRGFGKSRLLEDLQGRLLKSPDHIVFHYTVSTQVLDLVAQLQDQFDKRLDLPFYTQTAQNQQSSSLAAARFAEVLDEEFGDPDSRWGWLFIDDVGALDSGSLRFLEELLSENVPSRFNIVGAVDSERKLSSQWHRYEVFPFSQDALGSFLKAVVPNVSWHSQLTDQAWQKTRGVPFYLCAWVRSAIERVSDTLSPKLLEEALLQETDASRPYASILDPVQTALADQPQPREVLYALALLDAPGSLTYLKGCLDQEEAEIEASLAPLVDHHFIEARSYQGVTTYRPKHPLIAEALRSQLSWEDQRAWHVRIARQLKTQPGRETLCWKHWERSGVVNDEAFASAYEAGEKYRQLGSNEEAAACFQWCLEHGASLPESDASIRAWKVEQRLGEAKRLLGEHREAVRFFLKAANSAEDPNIRSTLLREAAAVHLGTLGNIDEALRLLSQAQTESPSPEILAYVYRDRAEALRLRGDYMAAEKSIRQGLEALTQTHSEDAERVEAMLEGTYGQILSFQGRFTKAERHLLRGVKLARAAKAPMEEARINTNLSTCFSYLGRYRESLQAVRRAQELGEELGDVRRLTAELHGQSNCEFYMGNLEEAERIYLRGIRSAQRIEDRQIEKYMHYTGGAIALQQGDWERALERFESCVHLSEVLGHDQARSLGLTGLAQLALERGFVSQAQKHLRVARSLRLEDPIALAMRLHLEAKVALSEANAKGSLDLAQQAQRLLQQSSSIKFRAPIHVLLSEIYQAGGNAAAAREEAMAALDFANMVEVPMYKVEGLLALASIASEESLIVLEKASTLCQQHGFERLGLRSERHLGLA
ncbi:MAG: protein kinase, partial [Candidatus Eisenbacteria bacterium]|nr:protein kinase [Candidatus Eisenbacteria bacterium]